MYKYSTRITATYRPYAFCDRTVLSLQSKLGRKNATLGPCACCSCKSSVGLSRSCCFWPQVRNWLPCANNWSRSKYQSFSTSLILPAVRRHFQDRHCLHTSLQEFARICQPIQNAKRLSLPGFKNLQAARGQNGPPRRGVLAATKNRPKNSENSTVFFYCWGTGGAKSPSTGSASPRSSHKPPMFVKSVMTSRGFIVFIKPWANIVFAPEGYELIQNFQNFPWQPAQGRRRDCQSSARNIAGLEARGSRGSWPGPQTEKISKPKSGYEKIAIL